MNVQKAREYARYVRGHDAGALDMCPAQDFARVKSHRVPRADRPVCWRVSSGEIRGGRMAALKSDPVWEKLSRFGRRYTPIDYGSGMGMEDIDRDEAGELGLEAEVSSTAYRRACRKKLSAKRSTRALRAESSKCATKSRFPLGADKRLPNARICKSSAITEFKNIEESARASLEKGETVNTPSGELKFGKHIYEDRKDKSAKGVSNRLKHYEFAKALTRDVREIRQQGERQTFVNYCANLDGKLRGMVVVVKYGNVAKNYFIKNITELDKSRKGMLLYQKDDEHEK